MRSSFTAVIIVTLLAVSRATVDQDHLCGPPEIPDNGSIRGGARSSYDLGDYVEYVCNYGYEIQGSNVAVCIFRDGGGQWNNQPPVCKGNRILN